MSPLTLDAQVDDLTELIIGVTGGRCALAGHSWGGLLVQLAALGRPALIVDPADEDFRAPLPPEAHRGIAARGSSVSISIPAVISKRPSATPFGPSGGV